MPRIRILEGKGGRVLGGRDVFAGEEHDVSPIDAFYAVERFRMAEYVTERPTDLPNGIAAGEIPSQHNAPTPTKGKQGKTKA